MKIFLFSAILLFSLPSHASQIVPHYTSLNDISCAILVAITSYDLKQNLLQGKVTKTWGKCLEQVTEWQLWKPVEWREPGVSPIEVSYREATRRREFKKGEEIILIRGNGWETFDVIPRMLQRLEFIFHKEAFLKEAILKNNQEELAALLSDPTSSKTILQELTKNKKLSLPLALKAQYLSQKIYSSDFYKSYLPSVSPAERLVFFTSLVQDRNYRKLPQAAYRLKEMLIYDLTDQEESAWRILMDHFDSSVKDENTEKVYFLRNKSTGHDKEWVLKKWIEVMQGPSDENVVSLFIGDVWKGLSISEKEGIFPDMVSFLRKNPGNYLFNTLTTDFESFLRDPRYAEALEFFWSAEKFFDDDTSDSYFFTELILKAAKTNKAFRPVLRKLNVLSKKHKKKYPFQEEIDQLLR